MTLYMCSLHVCVGDCVLFESFYETLDVVKARAGRDHVSSWSYGALQQRWSTVYRRQPSFSGRRLLHLELTTRQRRQRVYTTDFSTT